MENIDNCNTDQKGSEDAQLISDGEFPLPTFRIYFQIGLFGVDMPLDEFKAVSQGTVRDPQAVLRNVAINLGLAGTDLDDVRAINAALAGATFKVS